MALIPTRRRPPQRVSGNPNRAVELLGKSAKKESLAASGYRLTRGRRSTTYAQLVQGWQDRAFGYYDEVGEINFACQFYARILSPLRLYPAKRDAKGDWQEIEPGATGDDQKAYDALDRVQDPGGGREHLLGNYGRLMFIAGEGLLFCSQNPDTEQEQWEMLSRNELRVQDGTYLRYKAPSLQAEEYREPSEEDWQEVTGTDAVAYRLWRRHPQYSELPDSTMRGILDLCEELLLLSRAVRSRTRNRAARAGILLVAQSISHKPPEPVGDEDATLDPFLADLTEAMMTAIEDEAAASGSVPLVVRVPVDKDTKIDDMMKLIQLQDPTELYPETGLRMELLKRMSVALDMPPEVLLGLGDTNHWNAWQIDEQTWKLHGMPLAKQLVGDLNAAYYLPQLREDGVADWNQYGIRYDAAEVINHPDRTKDAKDLHGLGVLSDKAVREAGGFGEDDAPSKAERNRWLGVRIRDASLAVYGIPSVKPGGLETEPGVIEVGDPGKTIGVPAPGSPADSSDVVKGPPEEPTQTDGQAANGNGHVNVERVIRQARLLGAVDLALLRAREVAGNRIVSLAKRDPEATRMIEESGCRARDAAAVLGPVRCRALGAGDARTLVAPASALLTESLRTAGLGQDAIDVVVDRVEEYAAKTLYETRPATSVQLEAYIGGAIT